ncbi:hypothetical protein KL930_003488 [Ogataea haglerorum]|uniref:Uncharacterized protein n=1 Tax=Ogataea haglerorum TaxID=1937702 RepID=A0AAN6D5R8_9ASCO|nr:uncharacterized protein KL911_003080 [Ogataea haglerorum]KAG7705756.1 hypothetical protein KL914_003594 [Ogataea haglerorum]KAG7707226.1 hypothetical protein KL950_002886 [Ogataea haglerorum]KAG7727661.1 hypothetical protein KL933_002595 [Ogataea haglerorum]KAG7731064.1 hypothetical protein KL948_003344 [Ogataea haglerorum]KAG7737377.1 hypothetical protein KL923_003766 [Ogataea haglerorum]
MPEEVLPYHKEEKRLAASEYEKYDPIRERFSYVIVLQVFLLYLIYLYYDHINEYHPLLAGALLGAQTSCLAQSLNQFYQRTISISKHIKFYVYGIFNGAATTLWIKFLVSQVDTKLMRFVYDQTFAISFILRNYPAQQLMADDTYYLTVHEAALAVVATAMKKSRLKPHILVINSIIGAILFSAGGMLDLMVQALNPGLVDHGFVGVVSLLQGSVYSIGLFFVISMGMELFNSNVLFFSVGVMRGAVSVVDLLTSWFVSLWVNLGATIFVVYLFCHVSGITSSGTYVSGSRAIAEDKESFSFMQTFLKGVAGNFFVCLAVYLQIMVKPLHVKLIMIYLPVFTFVSMGFTHCVADMFLIPAGLFNKCSFGWGRYFWKLLLPATLGNMVGGSFFGVVIPWYLHLVVIEQDMKQLHLPDYEERDEQPELNMDSRVVRTPGHSTVASLNSTINYNPPEVQPYAPSTAERSPSGVFPVYDMGEPLERERSIAQATEDGTNLRLSLTRGSWRRRATRTDAEAQPDSASRSQETIKDRIVRHLSRNSSRDDMDAMRKRLSAAGITAKIASHSNDIAGIHQNSIDVSYPGPTEPRLRRVPTGSVDPADSSGDSSSTDEKRDAN